MSILKNKICVGDSISPFMVCGVPSSRYEGERVYSAFRDAADKMLYEIRDQLASRTFIEYDETSILGNNVTFQCFDRAPTYAAGSYTVYERYAVMPIYMLLESESAQKITLDVFADRLLVVHNGLTVYDNKDFYSRAKDRVYVFEHQSFPNIEKVELELVEGENRILFLTGRVNRSSGFMFTAVLKEAEGEVFANIPLSIEETLREKLLISQRETHLTDNSYICGEGAQLIIGGEKDGFEIEIYYDGKKIDCEIEEGAVHLPDKRNIGNHTVDVVWKLPSGKMAAKSTYTYGIARVIEPMPGYENFKKRRDTALIDLANKKNFLALYRLERYEEITEDLISPITDKILRRDDCADFHLLPLLWMAWEDMGKRALGEEIHKRIKDAALAFKYWVDESGASSMFFCSENHRIGFHVCEYLAGLLYPRDTFTNSYQNGVFHSMKGRMHLMEWLTQRCKFGFDEPHSDNYFPVTFSALLVLREVLPLEEYPLRNMVNILLDFMVYIAASGMFDGVLATPRGRSYSSMLRSKYSSPMTSLSWMMFGNSDANPAFFNQEFAFSPYIPPRALTELADDYSPTTFYFKEGLMHFDKHNADFTLRRTPDYMMGGVRDHNVGMCDMHFTPMLCALKGNIPIFISAPQNNAEGSGLRPDYWAGEAHLPRVLMHERVLITIFHKVTNLRIWMTHCHFPKNRFCEVLKKCDWTFGRKENGYVAIYSSTPHELAKNGVYAGRELVANGRECVWITVMGSLAEDGSFESFIEKVLSSAPVITDNKCSITSVDGTLIEFGLDSGFYANGKEIEIPEYLSLSPWLRSKFGSGKYEYSYKDFNDTLWSYPAIAD